MESALACTVCGAALPAGTAGSAYLAHVNACRDDARSAPPGAGHLLDGPLLELFRPRLHDAAHIAAFGPPATGAAAWPAPSDGTLLPHTPGHRAIIVRGGCSYVLAGTDAQLVAQRGAVSLLLGSEAAARCPEFLRAQRVRGIVNCAYNSDPLAPLEQLLADFGVLRYSQLQLADAHGEGDCSPERRLIEAGADALADAIAAINNDGDGSGDGSVLIHCVAGMSRSGSVVMAYLVKHAGYTLVQAGVAVKTARPVVYPNAGFWRALRDIERDVRGAAQSEDAEAAALDSALPLLHRATPHWPHAKLPIDTCDLRKLPAAAPAAPARVGDEHWQAPAAEGGAAA